MSAASFPIALAFTLKAEGGFVDDPYDPGGPTCQGITLVTFRAAFGPKRTVSDLQHISPAEVATIYRSRYWDAVRGDELPPGVDLSVFDMGVNAGPRRSVELLQLVLGARADGVFGPRTLASVTEAASRVDLIGQLAKMQQFYYTGLPGWSRYGKGWQARVAARQAAARGLYAARGLVV